MWGIRRICESCFFWMSPGFTEWASSTTPSSHSIFMISSVYTNLNYLLAEKWHWRRWAGERSLFFDNLVLFRKFKIISYLEKLTRTLWELLCGEWMSNLQMKHRWGKVGGRRATTDSIVYTNYVLGKHLFGLPSMNTWDTFSVVGTRKIHRKYTTLAIKNQPKESVISTYEIARTYFEDRKHVKYSSDLKKKNWFRWLKNQRYG